MVVDQAVNFRPTFVIFQALQRRRVHEEDFNTRKEITVPITATSHNAKQVLPPRLLAELQHHVIGHLWVPAPERQAVQLRQRIMQLHQAGMSTREIAGLVDVTQRRVQQIVREVKRNHQPDAE